eukprot:6703978-Prymnesium_polylepis.1
MGHLVGIAHPADASVAQHAREALLLAVLAVGRREQLPTQPRIPARCDRRGGRGASQSLWQPLWPAAFGPPPLRSVGSGCACALALLRREEREALGVVLQRRRKLFDVAARLEPPDARDQVGADEPKQ